MTSTIGRATEIGTSRGRRRAKSGAVFERCKVTSTAVIDGNINNQKIIGYTHEFKDSIA
jgi:hypothetical protein